MDRAAIAKHTLEICEAGHYITPNGARLDLQKPLAAAKAGTRLYKVAPTFEVPAVLGGISVSAETTLQALQRLHKQPGGHLGCLNFAFARNAGGGFLKGSQAQEESLARSSGLYPCLITCPEYYETNRNNASCLYTDLTIWSPQVPFFKDDSGQLLSEPILASVITSPAPNAGVIRDKEPQ